MYVSKFYSNLYKAPETLQKKLSTVKNNLAYNNEKRLPEVLTEVDSPLKRRNLQKTSLRIFKIM